VERAGDQPDPKSKDLAARWRECPKIRLGVGQRRGQFFSSNKNKIGRRREGFVEKEAGSFDFGSSWRRARTTFSGSPPLRMTEFLCVYFNRNRS
jgi:hypothetical protein